MKAQYFIFVTSLLFLNGSCAIPNAEQSHTHSPYSGQEKQAVKALSDSDIASYLNGEGMGLAKAAELNGYPGPMHALENEGALEMSSEQKAEAQKSFQKMKHEAVRLGKQLVDHEKELDSLFSQNKIDSAVLREKTESIGKIQGNLRDVHLQAHLEMMKILSPEQVDKYNRLRGYKN